MRSLTLDEAEFIAHAVAKELMDYGEPLPDFSTRHPGRLESCLQQPFQSYGGQELYPSLTDKAAVLFYLVNKNHPFTNGNKRMAVILTLLFVWVNDKWINVGTDILYKIAYAVADGPPERMEQEIKGLSLIFKTNLVNRSQK